MPQPLQIGDRKSALFNGLSGFWTRFFRDTADLHAFYNASEIYIGQAYLDMLSDVLNTGIVDTPVFNKEYWQFFTVREDELDFIEGASVAEDRYRYDMPGSIRITDFLQNSIFDPSVVYERGVNFDVQDEDGYARFRTNPFREYEDPEDGAWLPKPGVAWRSIDIEVGNQFRDVQRDVSWWDDSEVKPGDTLRILAQAVDVRVDDGSGTGQVFFGGLGVYRFVTANPLIATEAIPGDVVQVYGSGTIYDGNYIIKDITSPYPGFVDLEPTFYAPPITSPATLNWRLIKMSYFSKEVAVSTGGKYKDPFLQDYPVSYIDVQYLVGHTDTPFSLVLKDPLVYAVVRDIADPDVIGLPVSPLVPTDLGYTHVIPGTLKVYALRTDLTGNVREGEDYTVNYLTGQLTPLVGSSTYAWDPLSINTCSFQYRRELLRSASGIINEREQGTVKQLAFWVPESKIDRFNLYYHYGYLLNRFEASSESYKSFLRGIMHLYAHGPIFNRMVAGMNVVAGYPLIKTDGEVLTGYFNGVDAQSAIDGQIVGATKTFTTTPATYSFTDQDVGGWVIFPNATSSFNRGKFKILEVLDPQTVLLESPYPMDNEGPPLEWILSRFYEKVVTTSRAEYKFPYFVPMRSDVEDPENIDKLTFQSFEAITDAFSVVDYLEAPLWWVGKTIPYALFPTPSLLRRIASSGLFEHIVDPSDDAAVDDPGLYFDGDDEGYVTDTPYRHNVGFVLFDQYLKYHMFYVSIDPALELPATFRDDVENVVLVTKPTYTYPYVEPSEPFVDEGILWDEFFIAAIKMYWGDQEGIELSDNDLRFDAESDLAVEDYFCYVDYVGVPLPFPLPPGPFALPLSPGERPLVVNIHATVGGQPVLEGVNYSVGYDPNAPDFGLVTPMGPAWDPLPPSTCDMECAAIVNQTVVPFPDTRVGFTPLIVDGGDPAYVRKNMHMLSLRTEHVDRPLSLKIDTGVFPFYYVYP